MKSLIHKKKLNTNENSKDGINKKVLGNLVTNINDFISYQLGRNYKLVKLNRNQYRELSENIKQNLSKNNSLINIEKISNEKDLSKLIEGFSVGLFLKYFETNNNGLSLNEFLEKEHQKYFEISKNSFLNDTKIEFYRESFFKIIKRIVQEKRSEVLAYLSTIPSEEITNINQFIVSFNIKSKILEKNYTLISPALINKYIEIHEDLNKLFEKQIRIAYGILKILNKETNKNDSNNFKDTERIDTYTMYKYLKSNTDFKNLVEPFTTLKFNAEKHIKYRKKPSKKEIVFDANDDKNKIEEKDRTMSYIDFLQNTKEIFAVLYILRFRDGIRLVEIQKINEYIKNFK